MENMAMNEATFREIMGEYRWLASSADEIEDIFNFMTDILQAEANAIKASEPYAKNTIREFEQAATTVNNFRFDVACAHEEVFGK